MNASLFLLFKKLRQQVDVVKLKFPDISTIIDIGGEDAKVVYLNDDGNADLRMNGNCAGGTGAFIDQMTTLLGVTIEELDSLAQKGYKASSDCFKMWCLL